MRNLTYSSIRYTAVNYTPSSILAHSDHLIFSPQGELMWPPPPPVAVSSPPPAEKPKAEAVAVVPVDPRVAKLKSALATTVGLSGLVGLGLASPSPAFMQTLSTFTLSGIVGESI